jgi:hypothetical protein
MDIFEVIVAMNSVLLLLQHGTVHPVTVTKAHHRILFSYSYILFYSNLAIYWFFRHCLFIMARWVIRNMFSVYFDLFFVAKVGKLDLMATFV